MSEQNKYTLEQLELFDRLYTMFPLDFKEKCLELDIDIFVTEAFFCYLKRNRYAGIVGLYREFRDTSAHDAIETLLQDFIDKHSS